MTKLIPKSKEEELAFLRQEIDDLRRETARLELALANRATAVAQDEMLFRRVFNDAPIGMALVGLDEQLLEVNQALCDILGYSKETLLTKTVPEITHPDDIAIEAQYKAGTRSGQFDSFWLEKRYIHANGSIVWGRLSVSAILNSQGQPLYFVGQLEDITTQKQAEFALKQSQEELEAFFSQSLDGCFFMMLDEPLHWDETMDQEAALDYAIAHQRITKINQAMLDQYGTEESQFLGLTPADLMAHDITYGRTLWRELFDYGRVRLETDERKLDGTPMWIEGEYVCLYDEDGRITGHFGIQRDITERKQAEAELRQSETLHRTLIRAIPYGVQEVDVHGRITYVNPAYCQTTGYSEEELIGRPIWELLSDPDEQRRLQETVQYLHQAHPQPETYYTTAQTKDGRTIYTQTDWDYRQSAEGTITGTIAVITDITARKYAQKRLENYNLRLKIVHEVAQAILSVESTADIALAALSHIQHSMPISRGSLVLFNFATRQGVILASYDQQNKSVRTGISRPLDEFDIAEPLFTGQYVIRLSLEKLPPGLKSRLQESNIHSYVSFPLIVQGKLFGVLYLAAENPDLYQDDNHMATLREIAELLAISIQQARLHEQVQQHAELLEERVAERTQALTQANEKLKELDRLKSKFITDVSHELRTPVTNLSLYLDLLERGSPERVTHYMQVMREQTDRLKSLVAGTLDLSHLDIHREGQTLTPQAVNPIIKWAASAYRDAASEKGLAFTLHLAEELPAVMANADQMSRAVSNIISNAILYTTTGQIDIRTYWDETAVSVVIQIQDTGIGMDEEDISHCFEPFYRSLRLGQLNIPGSGLGLALAKEIVELHNGRIQVASKPNSGSTFTIFLPAAPAAKS